MNAQDINARLLGQIESFLGNLFPEGQKKANEFEVGSLSGEKGTSLKVHLYGDKGGYWKDFATGQRGKTLVGLYAEARCNGDFATACKELKQLLGIAETKDTKFSRAINETFERPSTKGLQAVAKANPVLEYLCNQRLLTPETLNKGRVFADLEGTEYGFPHLSEQGADIIFWSATKIKRTDAGKKLVRRSPGCKAILYGKHMVPRNAEYLIITEGHLDALTWTQFGFHAVSVPSGTEDLKFIEYDYDFLERFPIIYLSMDMDGPGRAAVEKIVERLGKHRCYIVELPQKDANECLLVGDLSSPEDFQECLDAAKMIEIEEIRPISAMRDSIYNHMTSDSDAFYGTRTPWENLPWRVRRKELTVITGYNNHGKSQGLSHLLTHLSSRGWRAMVASMENSVEDLGMQIAQCLTGESQPDRSTFDLAMGHPAANHIIFDKQGSVKSHEIIDAFRYCVSRFGCNLLVIDSWMLCGISEDDLEAQKEFAASLVALAKETDSHIMIVAHARKGENEIKPPGKMDIKGAGSITDLAHNVLCWFRDVGKQERITEAKLANNPGKVLDITAGPDGAIYLYKQRNGRGAERGKLGKVYVWFDQPSGQFLETREGRPFNYLLEYEPSTV
jgi:twinkle protein